MRYFAIYLFLAFGITACGDADESDDPTTGGAASASGGTAGAGGAGTGATSNDSGGMASGGSTPSSGGMGSEIGGAPAGGSSPGGGAVCVAPDGLFCLSLPEECPAGQVSSIEGICWGPCVPIDQCACATADDCPNPDQYTCHLSAGRCGPYV